MILNFIVNLNVTMTKNGIKTHMLVNAKPKMVAKEIALMANIKLKTQVLAKNV
jgi:hypothetical protein